MWDRVKINYNVCVHAMREHVWFIEFFIVSGQQWSSATQRNKIHQATIYIQYLLVGLSHRWVWMYTWDLLK